MTVSITARHDTFCGQCHRWHLTTSSCLRGVLLVCGGRDFANHLLVDWALGWMNQRAVLTAIRHGCARGADTLAGEWARKARIPLELYPADWRLGRSAGPRRNEAMLQAGGLIGVVAFPGGTGTRHMVRISRAAGLPVWVVPNEPSSATLPDGPGR